MVTECTSNIPHLNDEQLVSPEIKEIIQHIEQLLVNMSDASR